MLVDFTGVPQLIVVDELTFEICERRYLYSSKEIFSVQLLLQSFVYKKKCDI